MERREYQTKISAMTFNQRTQTCMRKGCGERWRRKKKYINSNRPEQQQLSPYGKYTFTSSLLRTVPDHGRHLPHHFDHHRTLDQSIPFFPQTSQRSFVRPARRPGRSRCTVQGCKQRCGDGSKAVTSILLWSPPSGDSQTLPPLSKHAPHWEPSSSSCWTKPLKQDSCRGRCWLFRTHSDCHHAAGRKPGWWRSGKGGIKQTQATWGWNFRLAHGQSCASGLLPGSKSRPVYNGDTMESIDVSSIKLLLLRKKKKAGKASSFQNGWI